MALAFVHFPWPGKQAAVVAFRCLCYACFDASLLDGLFIYFLFGGRPRLVGQCLVFYNTKLELKRRRTRVGNALWEGSKHPISVTVPSTSGQTQLSHPSRAELELAKGSAGMPKRSRPRAHSSRPSSHTPTHSGAATPSLPPPFRGPIIMQVSCKLRT